MSFGLFNAQDNLGFIADFPSQSNRLAEASVAYASALAIDSSVATVISVTLTGNVASMTFSYGGSSTIPSGVWFELRLIQDATGGRTVAWPANLLLDGGFVVDSRAQRATVLQMVYDTGISKWKLMVPSFSVPTA